MQVCELKHYATSLTNLFAFLSISQQHWGHFPSSWKISPKTMFINFSLSFWVPHEVPSWGLMILKCSLWTLNTMCTLHSMHTHATTKGSGNNSHNTQCSELEPSPLLSLPGELLLAFFWLQDISCCFCLPSTWVICYTSEIHTF